MNEFETIEYTAADGVATITLARPDKRNAINAQMFRELGEAVQAAADDVAVRAVLVEAEGPAFCAGIDLAAMGELATLAGPPFRTFVRMAQRPFALLARMPKPTLAAVRGHALGAGFQLALACDLRVVATDVSFGMLEARFGLIPDLGGMHHLARMIGPARAKELVWTARTIDAKEADRLGLANRLVDHSELPVEARALLDAVLAHSPIAASLSKALISRAAETAFETELEREADAQVQCLHSEEHRESVAAFLGRRAPRFGS